MRRSPEGQRPLFGDGDQIVSTEEKKTRDKASLEVTRFVLRPHPFDLKYHQQLITERFSQGAMETELAKLKSWLKKPGRSIVVENNGVLWSLWCVEEGAWVEYPHH